MKHSSHYWKVSDNHTQKERRNIYKKWYKKRPPMKPPWHISIPSSLLPGSAKNENQIQKIQLIPFFPIPSSITPFGRAVRDPQTNAWPQNKAKLKKPPVKIDYHFCGKENDLPRVLLFYFLWPIHRYIPNWEWFPYLDFLLHTRLVRSTYGYI